MTKVSQNNIPELPELPEGWVRARMDEVSEINPKHLKDTLDDNLEVSFLPMKAVKEKTGKIDLSDTRKVSQVKKGYTPFRNGDVLFAKITPCMENGKIAIVENLKNKIGFGSTEFHVLRPKDFADRKLLFFFLLQDDYRKVARRSMTGTAGQLRVPVSFLEKTILPLPPLPEQKRIVAKIEELFTRLDAGVEVLKKVKAEIKRYRQAVLKHAFEGRLTGEWRKNVGATLAVAPDKGAGISPAPTENLPEGWVWVRVGDICDLINGRAFKPSEWAAKGLPIIRIQNLNNVKANFNYCDFKVDEKYLVNNGQLLFAWSGTPGTSFGAHIWKAGKAVLNQHIFKVGIDEAHINKVFLMYLLNRNVDEYIRKAHGTAGLAHITKGKFENSAILLPPLTEQHKIVEEIERRFSIADEVEATIDQSLKQAQRLRQSILKRAFEGRLVPQDPTDEPASALLERIRLNRESKKGIKTGRRKPRGEKSAGMA